MSQPVKQLYEQMVSGECIENAQPLAVRYLDEEVRAEPHQLLYHSRTSSLQLYLLQISLLERQEISYDNLLKVLKLKDEIELEQVFASLIL